VNESRLTATALVWVEQPPITEQGCWSGRSVGDSRLVPAAHPHLGVHVEQRLQRSQVGPVTPRELRDIVGTEKVGDVGSRRRDDAPCPSNRRKPRVQVARPRWRTEWNFCRPYESASNTQVHDRQDETDDSTGNCKDGDQRDPQFL